MEYRNLGNTGLTVSRICLGCMSYGEPDRGHPPWSLPAQDSVSFFTQALDAGINFFDTANIYSLGSSEEIVGQHLLPLVPREDLVIATKAYMPMRKGPNALGLSRQALMTEIDHSLRRLGTDYVDLYQIHRFDPTTPVEETAEALHDIVKAGKARYVGASSMYAWQFAKYLWAADKHGWTSFVSMQNHYNLLYREEEREMIPLCLDQGIGIIPWSPLARGRLSRPADERTHRSERDDFGQALYGADDAPVVDAVGQVAEKRGLSRSQVALAWMLSKPGVTAPIIGATKPEHLADAIAAVDITLDGGDIAAVEAAYRPHAIAGHV